MNDLSITLKQSLFNAIDQLSLNRESFVSDPSKDFLRNRKLTFSSMFKILLSMGPSSISNELLEYFSFDVSTASSSAFVQQRAKIDPSAFQFLFNSFTNDTKPKNVKSWNGYTLLAVDGTTLQLPRDSKQPNTYFKPNPKSRGLNQLHLDALYDLSNHIYLDASYQYLRGSDERKAFISMLDNVPFNNSTIFIADRGYTSYNTMAHVQHSGASFLFRSKDINSNGLTSLIDTPDTDEFDFWITLDLTRKTSKVIKNSYPNYKYMPTSSPFDFFIPPFDVVYPLTFRITRFKLSDNSYEVIFSNLDMAKFPPSVLKALYHKRWGIETSFRKLKHTIGLASFHSKKIDFILQEIFARLTLYNFCELITWPVVITQDLKKYSYQVNFTRTVKVCKYFLSLRSDKSPPNIEALIKRHLLPIRDNRSYPRKIKDQSYVSFLYRLA